MMASHLAGLGNIRDMSDAEFKDVMARGDAALKEGLRSHLARIHEPVSLAGCSNNARIYMTVVQHGIGNNAIRVSHNGDPANQRSLTLSARNGWKITEVMDTGIDWTPYTPGLLLIRTTGLMANTRELRQAKMPQLCPDFEWTDVQREAWDRLVKSLKRIQVNQDREYKRRKYDRHSPIYDTKLPSYRVGE